MNKIVLEHYPASKLPADLRGSIAGSASVKITVEEETRQPPNRERLLELMNQARRNAKPVTLEEAVQRIRKLRDEWD